MRGGLGDLFAKLRAIERAVPDAVRADANFLGLRIDECGRFVSIARAFAAADAIARLATLPAFGRALDACELCLDVDDDAAGTCLHALNAGDGAYPAHCTDHCFTANRAEAGTIGWFFWLDGTLVGVGSYHVFCPRGDATPLHRTCVYRYGYNGAVEGDFRIGALWDYDRADAARERIYDCALVRIADPSVLSGQLGACTDGTRLPYPRRLAAAGDIGSDDEYTMIGMKTRISRTTRFRGVGSRRLGRPGRCAMFKEQLFFDRCSAPGDSGAVIVHAGDDAVVGLVAAADARFTIASPLYRKPWRCAGLRAAGAIALPDLRIRSA